MCGRRSSEWVKEWREGRLGTQTFFFEVVVADCFTAASKVS